VGFIEAKAIPPIPSQDSSSRDGATAQLVYRFPSRSPREVWQTRAFFCCRFEMELKVKVVFWSLEMGDGRGRVRYFWRRGSSH
jgi:hypothetical protein